MTEHEANCTVCGTPLVYAAEELDQTCSYCGEVSSSPIHCPEGHFVCDVCHASDAIGFLLRLTRHESSTDPVEIAEKGLTHPSFKFHGPEHHGLVPAAILIALKNRGVTRPDGQAITDKFIEDGIKRGLKIPGGFCGYAGVCGACVGAGVATAIFLGSTPTRGEERTVSHKATSEALYLSQDGLKRCCKRATYYGLTAAMKLLREEYNIDLGPAPELASCKHSERNPDCATEDCSYYSS